MKIAVIGAGIAGVSLAKALAATADCRVELFDKSRGFGGACLSVMQASIRLITARNFLL